MLTVLAGLPSTMEHSENLSSNYIGSNEVKPDLRDTYEQAVARRKEDVVIREIPEMTENLRRVNMIPLQRTFNKNKFKKEYTHYFTKPDLDYCDSDVEKLEAEKQQKNKRKKKNKQRA